MAAGMAPDVERIIESIVQGDQDDVQLQLRSYNTQYAECFFVDTEVQERKKFRMNKVRDSAPDSDSDIEPDNHEPDLLLRQRLASALLCFISSCLQPAVLRVCLHTLRILSRDRRGLGPLLSDQALLTLARLGGLSPQQVGLGLQPGGRAIPAGQPAASHHSQTEASDQQQGAAPCTGVSPCSAKHHGSKWMDDGGQDRGQVVMMRGKRDAREDATLLEESEEDGEACRREAMKVLCNIIYNSQVAQERSSSLRLLPALWESVKTDVSSMRRPSSHFYKLRLLFLLTALRPELRLQLQQDHGVLVLTKALECCLELRWGEGYQLLHQQEALLLSKETSQDVIEILKTLFNIAHKLNRQEPDEEEAALYRHLADVLRHCLMLSCDGSLEELQGHTVNILSALPLTCLDVLVQVPVEKASFRCEGVNMDCVHTLLLFMERRLNRGQKLREKLTPVLSLLTESSRVHRETRRYLKQKILPPLRDVEVRPEQDTSLRGQLVRLMTHVDTDVKDCAAELLFVLCKENVSRFVKYTGYGNAAGLLAARGLLNGRRNSGAGRYSSDSDSDTEEYRQARARINLVTGRVEAEQPDPMEGMTEEEKEEEARRLICMINRLSRDRVIQPMGVTAEGRLVPLWGQMRDCTLEEEEDEDEDEEDDMDMGLEGHKDKME